MDKAEVEAVVKAQLPWMERTCKQVAHQHLDWRDLLQGALLEFVVQLEPWRRQEARESRQAQDRTLFRFCLRHKLKAEYTRLAREELTSPRPGSDDEDAAGGPADKLTAPTSDAMEYLREVPRIVELLRQLQSKARSLAAIALYLTRELLRSDVAGGATVLHKGKSWVRRDVSECWELLVVARDRQDLVPDETEWKRTLARLLRYGGPPGSMPTDELLAQVNVIEQAAGRAIPDVRVLIADQGA